MCRRIQELEATDDPEEVKDAAKTLVSFWFSLAVLVVAGLVCLVLVYTWFGFTGWARVALFGRFVSLPWFGLAGLVRLSVFLVWFKWLSQ